MARRGARCRRAVRSGDEVTGATTFRLEEGLDTGPTFGVVTEAVRPDDTAGTLLERLAGSGAGLLLATMDGIAAGSLCPVPQPADGVSIAPKVTAADAEIDWAPPGSRSTGWSASVTPEPGAWTTFRGERLGVGPVRAVTPAPAQAR